METQIGEGITAGVGSVPHVSALPSTAEYDDSPELAAVTNAAFKISAKVHQHDCANKILSLSQ